MGGLTVRRATDDDLPAILALLAASMGWAAGGLDEAYFRWKHLENPYGRSPMWVALDRGRVAGFRTFLRWEFEGPGGLVLAARAVDTVTHPDHRGRGVFSQLTLAALDELRDEGVRLVFNTPNDQSRPGYLKMGWTEVGPLPGWVRVGRLLAPLRMARARVPAALWSEASPAGRPAGEVLDDDCAVDRLLAWQPPSSRLRTHRTPAYLRWRYGFSPLRYRAVVADAGPAQGVAVFRVRRRGRATEAAVVDVLAPGANRRAIAGLASLAARSSGADYAMVLGRQPSRTWAPLPGGGPVLTCRPLDGSPPLALAGWALALGDVELF